MFNKHFVGEVYLVNMLFVVEKYYSHNLKAGFMFVYFFLVSLPSSTKGYYQFIPSTLHHFHNLVSPAGPVPHE